MRHSTSTLLFLLLSACARITYSATLQAPPLSSLRAASRLRGGLDIDLEDDDDEDEAPTTPAAASSSDDGEKPPMPEPRALTREEITEKLNEVPVFCVKTKEGGIVGMKKASDPDGKPAIMWHVDAVEARAVLKFAREANPDAGLDLGCHGLGSVFEQCNGWGDLPEKDKPKGEKGDLDFVLQGTHRLVEEVGPRLVTMLTEQGIDPGCWQLPVFMCAELQSVAIVPIFLNPAELARTWEKVGRSKDELPEQLAVMDIRLLVREMMSNAKSPWQLIHFVNAPESIALAEELGAGVAGSEA